MIGLVSLPLMLFSGILSMVFYGGSGEESGKSYEVSSKLLEEGTLNVRAVYSNGYQGKLYSLYCEKLKVPLD